MFSFHCSKSKLIFVEVFILLYLISNLASPVKAQMVWSDSFDDLSNWNVTHGAFDDKNGVITPNTCFEGSRYENSGGPYTCVGALWHDSSAVIGSWSFDLYMAGSKSLIWINIASNGPANCTESVKCNAVPNASYYLVLIGSDHGFSNNGVSHSIDFGYFIEENCQCGEFPRPKALFNELTYGLWMRVHITRDMIGNMSLYINTEYITSFAEINPLLNESSFLGIDLSMGDKLDNVTYWNEVIDPLPYTPHEDLSGQSQANSNRSKAYYIGAGAIFTTTIFSVVTFRKKKALTKTLNKIFSSELISTVSQNFELSSTALVALITKNNVNIDEDTIQSLPRELLNFKYLMHPIRMGILKLLAANDTLPSAEVRQILGITWGEYYTHLQSLETKGYIETSHTFNENTDLTVTLFITEYGRIEYEKFMKILKDYVNKDAPIRVFLSNQKQPVYDTTLYPINSDNLEAENNQI